MNSKYCPGEVIVVSCDAFFKFLNPEHKKTRCNTCFKRKEKMLYCYKCMDVRYCDEQCKRRSAEDGHDVECGSPCFNYCKQSWAKEDHMALFRLYAMMKTNPEVQKKPYQMHDNSVRCFDNLTTNQKLWETDRDAQNICADLVRHLKKEDRTVSINYFIRLYGIYKTNSLEIYDGGRLLGSGIYIQGSVFDHSCIPTARCTINDAKLLILATSYIAVGEQPLISYLEHMPYSSGEDRQQLLESKYKFQCSCDKCVPPFPFDLNGLKSLHSSISKLMTDPFWADNGVDSFEAMYNLYKEYIEKAQQLANVCNFEVVERATELADFASFMGLDSEMQIAMYKLACILICRLFGADSQIYNNFFNDRPNLSPGLLNNYHLSSSDELCVSSDGSNCSYTDPKHFPSWPNDYFDSDRSQFQAQRE